MGVGIWQVWRSRPAGLHGNAQPADRFRRVRCVPVDL